MPAALTITRLDLSSSDLKKLSYDSSYKNISPRLLCISYVLDKLRRNKIASLLGIDRQTVCDWIHLYNAGGVDNLFPHYKGRPHSRITPEIEAELSELVLEGPPADSPLKRWRRVDLQAELKKRHDIDYHERTIGKILKKLGFSHISVRPIHPETDLAAQEDFKKILPDGKRNFTCSCT